ncbi:MAG: DUF2238 domain-containing protein [Elusimicrobiales bacterium]|nr:DUF2238 domain-containing protein [Elusimicrobiales bacterium]
MNFRKLGFNIPLFLLLLYIIYFIIMGIKPYDRNIWIAENIPVAVIVLTLVLTYKKFTFSNTSYILMSIFIFLHTTGAHYTFERVPFSFFTELFGFQRNNFDRVAHFTVGFFAYPISEYIIKKQLVKEKWFLTILSISFILAVAAIYEIAEWSYTLITSPQQAAAFLGSQGDVWDAQKDMLMDGIGAIFSVILFNLINKK